MGKDKTGISQKQIDKTQTKALVNKARQEFDKVAKKAEKGLQDKKSAKHVKIMDKIERAGTLSDRVGVLMVKVMNSRETPNFADFASLDALIAMASKNNRRESEMTLDALKELFSEHLLPDYPLKYLDQSVKEAGSDLKKLAFEDKLKHKYSDFLHVLIDKAQDTVTHFKKSILRLMVELAEQKVEARDFILDAVVNKLGDKDVAVPTSIVVELTHAVKRKRELLLATIQAANRFAFRKNQTTKARFYVIVLLNAFHPRIGEIESVKQIVHIYLRLFPDIASDESHSKALALLLQAVNKIFPLYGEKAMLTDAFFSEQLDALYKFTHFGGNSVLQIQALRFLFQVYSAKGDIPDRFYRNLYEHISPLTGLREINVRTLNIFFHTLFLSIKADVSVERVAAFVKRLLQCCLITEPSFICAVLLLINEVVDYHPSVFTLVTQAEEPDVEEAYVDVPDSDEEYQERQAVESQGVAYDPLKRDPKFAHASRSCLYELTLLSGHYHPTVSHWAKALLQKQTIEYSGDPLLDFSLVNFLDRFGYQQPRAKLVQKLRTHKIRRSLVENTVNSKDFLLLEEDQVREEERFFHHFFKLRKIAHEAEPVSDEEEAFDDEDELGFTGNLEFQDESEEESKPKKRVKKSVFGTAEDYAHLIDS